MNARPQIIATIGPASHHLALELVRAGATGFRLNASHLDRTSLADAVARLSRHVPASPITVDLQGAKMRLGIIDPRDLREGDRLAFAPVAGVPGAIPLPHPELFVQVQRGDTLSVDDGRLRLQVVAASAARVEARALNGGRLLPRKGVNVEEHPVRLGRLSERDREACETSAALGVRRFAFSFMTNGEEAGWLREAVSDAVVVGKVERREAVEDLDRIAEAADEVWICRGDLGAQLGPSALARFVAALAPKDLPAPVFMAGQVLEHLASHPDPTRSEVCHLFDLVSRGYAGIVLSDETAIGQDPVHAVSVAAELLRAFAASR